ncbi:glycosyltransferase, partial [bacterium]|nr:glycosyltransferase [bacterium]
MTTLAAVIFWICAAAMVHTYVTYPLSLKLFRHRFSKPPAFADGEWPAVAVLIPAYNEEAVMGNKIRNSLELEYEAGKLEVLVGSDGSTDRTNEIVKSFDDPRIRLIELGGRNGKTGVLNHLVKATTAEILVFTDANVEIESDALRKLIRHFADPLVGTAGAGKYIRVPQGADEVKGEAIYADIVNRLKKTESDIGGMSGGLGSLMAMRRNL